MEDPRPRMAELATRLEEYNHAYYVLDQPLVPDEVYDALYRELQDLERRYPQMADPHSPTRQVGGEVDRLFRPLRHGQPMLSLTNVTSEEELAAFMARVERLAAREDGETDPLVYTLEPKIDGLSVRLVYREGRLVEGATRGDGEVGEDVTANLRTLRDLPLRLQETRDLEVRGEVYMPFQVLAETNRERDEAGESPFANVRNAAAGSLRQLDPEVTRRRHLRFFAYEWRSDGGPESQADVLSRLREMGFAVAGPLGTARGAAEAMAIITRFERERYQLPFATDGVVIKLNHRPLGHRLGNTAKAPRWAVAYKYPAEVARTRAREVVWQVGRTGVVTPTLVVEPVEVAGSVVSRATLHNVDLLRAKDVRPGDTVFIQKAGEVIPEVLGVDRSLRAGDPPLFPVPTHCPACSAALIREEGEAALRCINPACPGRLREGLLHFVSRAGMDLEGFGPKLIDALLEKGLVREPADLYTLSADDLLELPRMGKKSVENLLRAMEAGKTRPPARLLFALGIRHVGERAADRLLVAFGSLSAVADVPEDALAQVPDIGPKIAASLRHYFDQPQARAHLRRLAEAGLPMEAHPPAKAAGPLSGEELVFTGRLPVPREEARRMAAAAGGSSADRVTDRTTALVVGEGGGSKRQEADRRGVPVWDWETFRRRLEGK